MKLFERNIILFGKLFLPAISCAISINIFNIIFRDYTYATLIFFGLIIVLFNFNKLKYNYFISFGISVILSYITFFVAIAINFGIAFIILQLIKLKLINDNYSIPFEIISPLLMFKSYQILFEIKKNIFFKIIKWGAIALFIIYGLIFKILDNKYFIFWQFIMALSLQLILYQDEIKAVFNKKFGLKMNKK